MPKKSRGRVQFAPPPPHSEVHKSYEPLSTLIHNPEKMVFSFGFESHIQTHNRKTLSQYTDTIIIEWQTLMFEVDIC